MDNLHIYNQLSTVPEEAKKRISGGRLNGFTDINPMWRIKALTETFGPCGIGWTYDILKQWTEPGVDGEACAFCNINLRVKMNDQWSENIPGTGGSMLISKEKSGLRVSDECFKMALTDAISVAAKALGCGANVYFEKDQSKYDKTPTPEYKCADCGKLFKQFTYNDTTYDAEAAYNAAAKKCEDGKARCKECRIKAGYSA